MEIKNQVFNKYKNTNKHIAGIIIEPIQGEGGVVPGEKNFFKLKFLNQKRLSSLVHTMIIKILSFLIA